MKWLCLLIVIFLAVRGAPAWAILYALAGPLFVMWDAAMNRNIKHRPKRMGP